MAPATLAPSRPRISEAFLEQHRRDRISEAFARVVVQKGYSAVTVADIVSEAAIARNTFYETFPNKEAVGRALLGSVDIDDIGGTGLGSLAVELCALWKVAPQRADVLADVCDQLVAKLGAESAKLPAVDDDQEALQSKLPPGRHGLPREFVRNNQARRLLTSLAAVIADQGYEATTIADVAKAAATSRRTFYEHCASKAAAARDLVAATTDFPRSVNLRYGIDRFTVEVVARQVARGSADDLLAEASTVLRAIGEGR